METAWREQLDDVAVQRTVGPGAFLRGSAYARGNRVRELAVDHDGRLLFASVQGTSATPYRVVVAPTEGNGRWTGRCTCPVASNCKHVAAVMLVARSPQSAVSRPAVPDWEGPIAALVRAHAVPPPTTESSVALQLEVVEATPRRIRIRPVQRGASGRWVRTGISWTQIQYDYGRPRDDRERLAVLRAIYAAQLSRRGGYYAYDTPVHLDDLGPSLWRLLAQATDAGLELVSPKASAGPVVVADAATVCLDLRRASPSSGATLDPLVTIGTHTLEAAGVDLLGDPAHGLFVTDPGELASITGTEELTPSLLLAALDERPDEHVAGLLRAGQGLEIPAPDLPRFLQVYYPGLRRAVTVTSTDDSVDLPEVLPPRLALTVTFRPDNAVSLEWGYAYQVADGVACLPLDGAGDGAGGDGVDGVARDLRAEQGLLDDLDAPTRRLVRPALSLTGMDAVTFTQDVLPTLRDSDDVRLTVVGEPPEFRHAQTPPVVHLSTTDSDDTDWYDLAVAVSIEGEEIPFDEMFVALAGAQTHMVLASGTYFSLARPELEQLRSLIEEARALADRESDGLRLSVYQAGLWEELAELGVVEQQSERWANAVQGLLGVSELVPPALPTGFDADLRPYQVDGYHWLAFLWQHGLGGILADDMGLGKTVQTLAMFCHAREAGETPEPFLVVAPTSVVGNWEREAARFAPGLKVRTVTETVGRRGTPLAEDVAGADLVVTSYALFRIDFDSYQGVAWAGLVLDEAQFVKNHQAKSYQCARRLSAPFKLAITGTPLENSLMDLWSLLSIVAPGLFPSPLRFAEVYRKPIEHGGDPELLSTLRRRVRPLMLRRSKDQVITDLPPKQEQVLEVALNPRHQKIYQTHLQRERQKVLGLLKDLDKNRFAIFRSLTLLRQLSLDPALVDPAYAGVRSSKVDAFLEQLGEVVGEGHRALVFSQFTGFLATVRARLDAEGVPYCYLDGRTRNRGRRIAEFKDGDAPVFLISLKAGGVGLNLTEADYVFVLDPWWNPAVEAQAVDRTHRIGQDKTVMVYRLVATGTIEEKVMELKARKQSLFARVMDDEALLSAPLSVDDIKGLFG